MFDRDGFLQDANQWSPQLAGEIAAREALELTPAHWEIIELLREYYQQFEATPAMRALVKYTNQKLGPEKGRSIYLLGLFPGSPVLLGCKIAGLPKPRNCL